MPPAARGAARPAGQEGAARAVNVIVLLVVLLLAAVATWLLIRTADAASDINAQAEPIARYTETIADNTEAIEQLERTNRIARDILAIARPLDERLAAIVRLSGSIDSDAARIAGTAARINSLVTDINGTVAVIDELAEAIDATAATIETRADRVNANAARILDVATDIDRDVELINANLEDSIDIAAAIQLDAGNILDQAVYAHQTAACIGQKLPGSDPADRHCAELRDQPPGTGADDPDEPGDDYPDGGGD